LTPASSDRPEPFELLDANPVVRYLVGDHPDHSPRAKALIDSGRRLRISVVTLAEVGFVLTQVCGVPRADAVDAMIGLLERENVDAHEVDTDIAVEALGLCRPSGRVNFGDAMLWAVARAAGRAVVWTFDERFPPHGIELRQPP
jgi:predicted nucleic acid-binding protein